MQIPTAGPSAGPASLEGPLSSFSKATPVPTGGSLWCGRVPRAPGPRPGRGRCATNRNAADEVVTPPRRSQVGRVGAVQPEPRVATVDDPHRRRGCLGRWATPRPVLALGVRGSRFRGSCRSGRSCTVRPVTSIRDHGPVQPGGVRKPTGPTGNDDRCRRAMSRSKRRRRSGLAWTASTDGRAARRAVAAHR